MKGGQGKDEVQRDACAAITREFGAGPGSSSIGGGGGEDDTTSGAGAVNRLTAVLPSGTGKTVLALRVAEEMNSELTVVLVPSLELVSQSYRDWERWRGVPGFLDGWNPLAVCSSSTVDASILPRTTAASEIADYLRVSTGGPKVIFCTYHSAKRVATALRETGAACDLLICDEAHRCTGRTTKRDAQPLFDSFLPAARRLFLTATPRLIGAARDKDGALVSAGSMDDTSLFGKVRAASMISSSSSSSISSSVSSSISFSVSASVSSSVSFAGGVPTRPRRGRAPRRRLAAEARLSQCVRSV